MEQQERYEKICQKVLRRHYREYRKTVTDPFFVDSEEKAKKCLTAMLLNVREELEGAVYFKRGDINSRRIAEIIRGKYLNMGRKYGERYYKRILNSRPPELSNDKL